MTSRDLVYSALEFKSPPRVPRQMWTLPWAESKYPAELNKIRADFPDDICGVITQFENPPETSGDMYKRGIYKDEWGCIFTNIHDGVIGEVKTPVVSPSDDEWADLSAVHIPYELLSFDIRKINKQCAAADKFVTCGACPRPFEQLQFIRGTEALYMDLVERPPKMLEFIKKMHEFYCELLLKWAKTDVDALNFMDDWGSQKSLLINPKLWCEIFKPMYKDYIDIAHSYGKKIFMHSDGYILDIIPHLIELGLDAINSQIFCMDFKNLAQFKGKITFWGELDRQNLLPFGTQAEVREAVQKIYGGLWENGGCIAQLEFGPGAKPQNVYAAFDEWNKIN